MALSLNRERTNRGGKPLVSLGISGELGVLLPQPVPRRSEAMRLIRNCVSNQSMRDFPNVGRFDSMGFGLVSFEE